MTHEPTSTGAPHHIPTTCYVCSRHAFGIGIGDFRGDPLWLCANCIPLIEQLKAVTRFDTYENAAIAATIETVGPLIERNGSDLAEWTPEQVEEFVTEIILGFGTSIRQQVKSREVPF